MQRKLMAGALALVVMMAASPAGAKKQQVVRAPGGTATSLGLVVDASYDSRLDNLVPGYKILDVVLINQSFNIIMMDPQSDRWEIKLSGDGKSVNAIHDLRGQLPKVWSTLPDRLKQLLSYPLALPIGAREVVDIFVPENVDLTRFTELAITFKSIDTRLEILSRQ